MTLGADQPLLANGVLDDQGRRHLDVDLHPLTGHHELLLASGSDGGPARETEILARSVARIGAFEPVDREVARALTRGDRQRLVLGLVRQIAGDRLPLVARCENPACRALADLDLTVTDLLDPVPAALTTVDVPTELGPIVVREPTGEDDEACAAIADPAARRTARWCRLVVDLAGAGAPAPEAWEALPPAIRLDVAAALAEASTAPDLALVGRCPSCGAALDLWLDPLRMLHQVTRSRADRVYAEVHTLAWHYHWSEAEILSLPRPRRWRYLELIRRELDGRPGDWS